MLKASVIGASGYAGGELIRLLLAHPQAQIVHLTGVSSAGEDIEALFPQLKGQISGNIEELDLGAVVDDSDVIFTAMPYGTAVEPVSCAAARGKKLIDIGCDFRFPDVAVYQEWYKVPHARPDLAQKAVYGLPELFREDIKKAQIVGNPGCYPTAAILSLYPILKAGLGKAGSIIINAASGVSGAGKKPGDGNIFCAVDGSMQAYGVATHRHTPEIERILTMVSGEEQIINFTPHLAPMARGILATSYIDLKEQVSGEELTELYRQTYQDEYFIKVHDQGVWPKTKWSAGSNFCHVAVTSDPRSGRAIATAVIDNLVKGAAGQAVQNMNLLFGLDETQGLTALPIMP